MTVPTEIVQRVNRQMLCSGCGASASAACDCGKPYMPAGAVAAKAIAVNPDKSNRALAAEIGVSDMTVARARKAGATNVATETRVGADGKSYPATKTKHAREDSRRAQEKAAETAWAEHKAEAAQIAAELIKQIDQHLARRLCAFLVGDPLGEALAAIVPPRCPCPMCEGHEQPHPE